MTVFKTSGWYVTRDAINEENYVKIVICDDKMARLKN